LNDLKQCASCRGWKHPEKDFHKDCTKADGHRAECKTCRNERKNEQQKAQYEGLRKQLIQEFGNICNRCGRPGLYEARNYNFHHTDPSIKCFCLLNTAYLGYYGTPWFEDEMSKCVLLCLDCHELEDAKLLKKPH
jgi:hypothetical protein